MECYPIVDFGYLVASFVRLAWAQAYGLKSLTHTSSEKHGNMQTQEKATGE